MVEPQRLSELNAAKRAVFNPALEVAVVAAANCQRLPLSVGFALHECRARRRGTTPSCGRDLPKTAGALRNSLKRPGRSARATSTYVRIWERAVRG